VPSNAGTLGYEYFYGYETASGQVAAHGDLTIENNAQVNGKAIVGGDLTVRNNALLSGDVKLAGHTYISNNGQVLGQITTEVGSLTPCETGYSIDEAITDAAAFNENSQIAAHLTNGALKLTNNARLTIPCGDFYLTSLELGNNTTLTISPNCTTRLFVSGDTTMSNNSTFNCPPASGSRLIIISGADSSQGGQMVLKNNTDSVIELYAPRADIELENNATIFGGIVGRQIDIAYNGSLLFIK